MKVEKEIQIAILKIKRGLILAYKWHCGVCCCAKL